LSNSKITKYLPTYTRRCTHIVERKLVIDPWGETAIEDYSKLFEQFGVEPIDPLIDEFPIKHRLIRRKIIFGHRDLQKILKAIKEGEEYAVLSGIKPTGDFHLGTKLTAEEIIFFQKLSNKAMAFYCIADVEAWNDNGIPFDKAEEIAISNIADVLALGLDPKRVYVYRQSRERRVLQMATVFARGVSMNLLEAIYGPRHFGLYLSAIIQVADILLPQHPDFGGPKPTVIPVGADQDPHIRFARDIAQKYRSIYGFELPSATYHRLMRSLTGEKKMSKRNPMGMFTLTEELESVKFKIMNAFTGGRPTAKEQREKGGVPEICCVYEVLMFHFVEDDSKLLKIYEECVTGKRLCGECKREAAEIILKWLEEHRRRREKFIDLATKLVREGYAT